MIEIIILVVIAVWFVFAIKSGKKHMLRRLLQMLRKLQRQGRLQ